MRKKLVLASASPFRRHLMEQAGLQFAAEAADIDERSVEMPLVKKAVAPEKIAEALAIAKAREVAGRRSGEYVLGADQVMSMDGKLFHKCKSLAEATAQLTSMRGRTHRLSSALAIVCDDKLLWSHVSVADLTFRNFSPSFLTTYIKRAGESILQSVGGYQFEGLGQQLFEKIDGDYFTIIGLPMLPLLAALRDLDVIDG
jgi:septum formation protein